MVNAWSITGSADSELRVWDIEYIDSLVSLCWTSFYRIFYYFGIICYLLCGFNSIQISKFSKNACPRTVKLHRVYNHYLETGRRCRACFKKNEDGKWRGRWRWGRGGWRSICVLSYAFRKILRILREISQRKKWFF